MKETPSSVVNVSAGSQEIPRILFRQILAACLYPETNQSRQRTPVQFWNSESCNKLILSVIWPTDGLFEAGNKHFNPLIIGRAYQLILKDSTVCILKFPC
jgi:hypothetical protein